MKRFLAILLIFSLYFPAILFAETILLKSGKSVEGKIVEKTDKYIKIDLYDVLVPYFYDEIESIDGEKLDLTARDKNPIEQRYEPNKSQGQKEATQTNFNHVVIITESGEQVSMLELPESIRGIKVQGQTICNIKLLEDVLTHVKSLFDVSAKEPLVSLSFQYNGGHKKNSLFVWSEKWLAKGPTGSREYEVEFESSPESGTDFVVKESRITQNAKDAQEYYNQGVAYDQQGDFAQSILVYTKAIEINPDFAEAYSNRGSAYVEQKEFSRAIADFNKAISINPSIPSIYYNRGFVYFNQRNFTQAIYDYTKAIEINPDFAEAYLARAVVYAEIKEYDKSWAGVHKAEELGYAINPRFLEKLEKASGRDK